MSENFRTKLNITEQDKIDLKCDKHLAKGYEIGAIKARFFNNYSTDESIKKEIWNMLELLYKISLPLSFLRKVLLCSCSLSFCLLLFIFKDFFLIKIYDFMAFIFILVMIFADNYLVEFFEEIYDKIVLWIEKKKRSKIIGEK